jgi:MerR family transcriptional regulator, redox-sensitive transcriptional activator SoxR
MTRSLQFQAHLKSSPRIGSMAASPDPTTHDLLSIGEVSARSGVASSALRFYEDQGLVRAQRSGAGHRRYSRSVLRRIAFIQAAQNVGLSLAEIRQALDSLPTSRTPTRADWERLARGWRRRIDDRISDLEQLRDNLTSCIGCGCLSLRRCRLYNPGDVAHDEGSGARYLLGGEPVSHG